MSEIEVILQSNGSYKSKLMEDFLCNKLNATTLGTVDSEGNLVLPPPPMTTSMGASLQSINNNQQVIDNQSRQLIDNQNGNNTTTTSTNLGNINGNTQFVPDAASNVTDPNANTEIDPELAEVQTPVTACRRQLIMEVTDVVVTAHLSTTINTYQNVADAEKKIAENMASGNMPDMSKMAGNSGAVWEKFVSQMVPEITKAIQFINRLPGFRQIQGEDQMNLIKQGSFEVLLTRFCMLINTETGEMIDPSLSIKFPKHALSSMPMGQLLLEFFKVAEKFNPLHLTDGEIGLFSSLLVMSPERENLQNKTGIEKIEGLFKQAVYLLIKQNHTDADSVFTKLMSTIPIFREINIKHAQALSKMKMAAPSEFGQTFPSLHKEMYNQ